MPRRVNNHGHASIAPAAQLDPRGLDASAARDIVTYGAAAARTGAPCFGQRRVEQVDAHGHLYRYEAGSIY
jgi:hypothetical protein